MTALSELQLEAVRDAIETLKHLAILVDVKQPHDVAREVGNIATYLHNAVNLPPINGHLGNINTPPLNSIDYPPITGRMEINLPAV